MLPLPLTLREKAIARLLCEGLANREIAVELSISTYTVKNYVSRICYKFGIDTTKYDARVRLAFELLAPLNHPGRLEDAA